MTKAYSYLRFSTPEQAKGDSFRRQTALAEEYAARHGLELDMTLTFEDLGVSAFRGRNAEVGRLADFSRAVEDGLVPPDSFLLVESLDRISRQAARKAFRVLEDVVERGISVVTLVDGRCYTAEALDTDPMSLMLALLTFIRANEESETKARRLRSVWSQKRQQAAAKNAPMTAIMPGWLRLDRLTGTIEPVPERAAIVRRIFDLAASGVGLHGIASTLNDERVETFGRGRVKAALWHRSYVLKIVENPAVIGTVTPHIVEHVGGKKVRKPQEPVAGYYPAVVAEETFRRVSAMRLDGRAPAPRAGHAETVNLLAGLAACSLCGNTMTRVSKGSGKKAGMPRLVCTMARAGRCGASSVRLDVLDSALIANANTAFGRVPRALNAGDPDFGWTDLMGDHDPEAALTHVETRIARIVDSLASGKGRSPALRVVLDRLEREKEAAQQFMKAVAARSAAVHPGVLGRAAEAARKALLTRPTPRQEVNAVLRQVLSYVTVDAEAMQMALMWKHGAEIVVPFHSGSG